MGWLLMGSLVMGKTGYGITGFGYSKEVCFVLFDFEMCFAPQRRAMSYLSSGQLAPHLPL